VSVDDSARRPALDPLLGAALAREQHYLRLLADPATCGSVGYAACTPTRAEVDAGRSNCTTFIEAVLRDAGYDVDGPLALGALAVSIHDAVNIRAESGQLADGQRVRPVLPELLAPDADRGRLLATLVGDGDPRTRGVALALVASGQGAAVVGMDALRPGDVVQTWVLRRDAQGSLVGARGHATLVRRVRAVKQRSGETVLLDEATPAAALELSVGGVELLGSHLPEGSAPDAAGFRPGRSVFTRAPVVLDAEFARWYAVRPSKSPWALFSG
jgi:hypothetical protein